MRRVEEMKTGIIGAVTISALFLLILGTLSSSISFQEQTNSINFQEHTPTILYGSASYPRKYKNIRDLATSNEVDAIVHGTITAAQPYLKTTLDGHGQLLSTKYSFNVISLLKGEVSTDIIYVHQTGGTLGNLTLILREDPPMNVGDELILFLHNFKSREINPNDYYVEGGPQGRFIVHGSKVYGLADLYGIPDVLSMVGHLKTNGMSLSNFLDQIIQSK
jgi:hypothetical protein